MRNLASSGFATNRTVRFATVTIAFCCAVLSLFTSQATANDCYTGCPIITIVNCRNAEARVQAQLCCSNSETTLSEVFTVPGQICSNNQYSIGFLPCYVTGVFFIGPGSVSYTWDPQNCLLTIH